jgi:hypothetical protein
MLTFVVWPSTQVSDYDAAKDLFSDTCENFIKAQLETDREEEQTLVLHIDEGQLLMGTDVVTREDPLSSNLYNYVMPAFCDAINCVASTRPWLKVVVTGTNFFAPFVLNPGSQLKVESPGRLEVFTSAFVQHVVDEHFDINAADFVVQLAEVSANRRAVEHFLKHLKLELQGKDDPKCVAAAVTRAVDSASAEWSGPIRAALGDNASEWAIRTLAVLLHPESVGGTTGWKGDGDVISAPSLPEEVRQYALAGGLNIWFDGDRDLLERPTGCVFRFLMSVCSNKLAAFNSQQLDAFLVTSRSNPTDKGHAFERLLACELTMVDSKLYEAINLKLQNVQLFPDPESLGRPFAYEARIHVVDWVGRFAHRVLCVDEDPRYNGQRKVDVGWPMVDDEGTQWKVLSELKYVADKNRLWKYCATFFQDMINVGVCGAGDKRVAVFVSFNEFRTHTPQQAPVTVGKSALQARKFSLALLRRYPNQFIILEGRDLRDKCVLPISRLGMLVSRENDESVDVGKVSEEVSSMYIHDSPDKDKR